MEKSESDMVAHKPGSTAKSAEAPPFPFNKCPPELRYKIIKYALALPETLACPLSGKERLWLGQEELAIWKRIDRLNAVNGEFAEVVRWLLPMQRGCNLYYMKQDDPVAGMDPERDVLLTSNMRVPVWLDWDEYHKLEKLILVFPVRKIISYAHPGGFPILHCKEIDLHQKIKNLKDDIFDRVPLRFHINIPQLPSLQDVTLVWESAGFGFHVGSCAVYGPNVISCPIEGTEYVLYHYFKENELEAAKMFRQNGIPADSGVEWAMSFNENMSRYHKSEQPPLIGLDAYTWTKTAAGGQWAGFRVNEATREVYFRPLKWHEVKHAVQSCEGRDKENRQGREQTSVHLVIRVWRTWKTDETRLEDKLEGWIKVFEPLPGDPRSTSQIARLWKLAVGMIEESKSVEEWRHISPPPRANIVTTESPPPIST